MKFTDEQISTSLYDLFFNKIDEDLFIEKFIPLPIEGASDEINRRNEVKYNEDINWYKSRIDEYLILNEYSKNDVEHLINLKAEQFLKLNDEFDKDVFYRNEYLLFVDSIKDYLDSFNRGKYLHIDTVKQNNQFQFELSYNRTTGKTVLITTKNHVQLEIYFKALISNILSTIDKFISNINSDSFNNEEYYKKTYDYIKEEINSIDSNQGWNYIFYEEEDFNAFIEILSNYFNNNLLPNRNIIESNKKSKTRTAKVLNTIYKRCSNTEKLRGNKDFFKVIRVLSCLNEFNDDRLCSMMQR